VDDSVEIAAMRIRALALVVRRTAMATVIGRPDTVSLEAQLR
jgi:hypothetical protein